MTSAPFRAGLASIAFCMTGAIALAVPDASEPGHGAAEAFVRTYVNIDAAHFLPADDSSHGFDNMAGTLRISPLLMERYLAAAKTVSRLVVGSTEAFDSRTYHIGTEAERRIRSGDPAPGAEGGTQLRHYFPRDGDYEFTVSLEPVNRPGARRTTPVTADRLLELAVDGNEIGTFTVAKPDREIREPPKFRARAKVTAGEHDVAARFYKVPLNLVDGLPRSGRPTDPAGTDPRSARHLHYNAVASAGRVDRAPTAKEEP